MLRVPVLVERFLLLSQNFAHIRPQDPPDYRTAFRRAHEELWVIAQALCALAEPGLQSQLDQTRRAILEEIHARLPTGYAVIKPDTRSRPLRWYDHELSPELSFDPHLSGSIISHKALKTLRALLRAQGICVRRQLERKLNRFNP